MSKIEEKKQIVQNIEQKMQKSTFIVLTDYRGLNVAEITELREKLRLPGIEFKVLKNTMVEFALKNLGWDDLIEYLPGPNAVLFSEDDPVQPAKILQEFARKHKKLNIKVGLLEGKIVPQDKIKVIAELPSREILIATVLGTM